MSGAATASYQYNTIGNMIHKTEGSDSLTLQYFPAYYLYHPHAVVSLTGSQSLVLSYDHNGNLCATGIFADPCPTSGNIYTYDAENRLISRTVAGGNTSYTYDGNGALVKRTNADGTYTEYIGGIFEKTFSAAGTPTGTTKYYSALGRTIAVRQTPLPAGGAGTVTYLLADHLGTTVGAIDAATGAVTTAKYWPYGAPRSGAITQTDKLYTGQQQEPGDALGLYFYHARFYSTTIGRFVSADTSTQDGYNRYAYTRNNPLRHTDPTGSCIWDYDGPRGCGLDPVTPGEYGPPVPPAQADVGINPAVPYPVPVPPLPQLTPEQVQAIDDLVGRVVAGAKRTGADLLDLLGGYTFHADTGNVPSGDVAPLPEAQPGPRAQLAPEDRQHILEGDEKGNGGHRSGTGIAGKSEFPASWSDDDIIGAVESVANDPHSAVTHQGDRIVREAVRNGIEIRVVVEGTRIVTGFPVNVRPNP